MRANNSKSGFTLAELLIVVAIIAVLVAVAIPVFAGQLEKSREAVDLANARAAYAEISAAVLSGEDPDSITVNLEQATDDWQTSLPITLGGVTYDGQETDRWKGTPGANGTCVVSYSAALGGVVFNWSGGTAQKAEDPTVATISVPVFNAIERFINDTVNATFETSTEENKYARLRLSRGNNVTGNTNATDAYGNKVAQRICLDEDTNSYRVNTGDSSKGSISGLAQQLLDAVKSDKNAKSAFDNWDNVNINYIEVNLSGDGKLKGDRVDAVTGYQLVQKNGSDSYTVYTRKGDTWTIETGTKAEMLASKNAYSVK